jgi:hypothetical protein
MCCETNRSLLNKHLRNAEHTERYRKLTEKYRQKFRSWFLRNCQVLHKTLSRPYVRLPATLTWVATWIWEPLLQRIAVCSTCRRWRNYTGTMTRKPFIRGSISKHGRVSRGTPTYLVPEPINISVTGELKYFRCRETHLEPQLQSEFMSGSDRHILATTNQRETTYRMLCPSEPLT